jgi:5-hydroxyisourate hydrolase
MKSPITTHVLDTALGCPAEGIVITLEHLSPGDGWVQLARGKTNDDGRITDLLVPSTVLEAGTYRMTFAVEAYFAAQNLTGFYSSIPIVFELRDPAAHYHIPLLLSPYGYSTYRGS